MKAKSRKLQKIAHEIVSEGMQLDGKFQIATIINKLPSTRKDFNTFLRHKNKEFSLESLITCLWIEEESRKQDLKYLVLVVPNNNTKNYKCYSEAYLQTN